MAHFEEAIQTVLANEGGYCCDPADVGGATRWGICQRDHPDLDIVNLTREQACAIYQRDYWCFDLIVNQAVGTKLLDAAVNLGKGTAIRLLQRAVNACGGALAVDGRLGPNTLLGANAAQPDAILGWLRRLAVERYEQLIAANPKLEKFRTGWMKRAAR